MIVLISVCEREYWAEEGDVFRLTVTRHLHEDVIIEEEIVGEPRPINFIASFIFALDDGTCPSYHLCGFFGDKDNLPEEIGNAKNFTELTETQQNNFIKSVGIKFEDCTNK